MKCALKPAASNALLAQRKKFHIQAPRTIVLGGQQRYGKFSESLVALTVSFKQGTAQVWKQ